MRGKDVDAAWTVDTDRFEMEEERALWAAYSGVACGVQPGMGIRDFLQVPHADMKEFSLTTWPCYSRCWACACMVLSGMAGSCFSHAVYTYRAHKDLCSVAACRD